VALPSGERRAHLVDILKAIVDAGDAAEGARDVVEDALDHMGQDAEFGHTRGGRATQIVQCPIQSSISSNGSPLAIARSRRLALAAASSSRLPWEYAPLDTAAAIRVKELPDGEARAAYLANLPEI
jgi:hypothetical protein